MDNAFLCLKQGSGAHWTYQDAADTITAIRIDASAKTVVILWAALATGLGLLSKLELAVAGDAPIGNFMG